jgi:hypothetical protein
VACLAAGEKRQRTKAGRPRYELQPEYEALLFAGDKATCSRCRPLWEKDHDYFIVLYRKRSEITPEMRKARREAAKKAHEARRKNKAEIEAHILTRVNQRLSIGVDTTQPG